MSYVLTPTTDEQRPLALAPALRFDPSLWTVNFPRPMMAAVRTQGAKKLRVDCHFYEKSNLAGLIWESEDRYDHPLTAYLTDRDYRGLIWQFRWRSQGIRKLPEIHGPTLTIEGRDQNGASRAWYVRLWNYAEGEPDDAMITLRFDDLAGGFLHPEEADPVYAGDIDRLFISMVPPAFDGQSTEPFDDPLGGAGWVELTNILVDGKGAALTRAETMLPAHNLRIAGGYDDAFNVTPERIVRNAIALGYRKWFNHYVGMSHFYALKWDEDEERFIIRNEGTLLNTPCIRWHEDFFAWLTKFRFRAVVSLSFELFDAVAPEAWKQRAHDGRPALTGWQPPSTLLIPTHTEAMGYLQQVAVTFSGLAENAANDFVFQIGEPWWWYQLFDDARPCFYDATTTALYEDETGRPLPTKHVSVFETPNSAQQHYLDWLGGKLGAATLALRDAVSAVYPTTQVTMLLYTPQILDPAAPMLRTVNLPVASWSYPAFSFLQLEDYDYVIDGEWYSHGSGLDAVASTLGYGPSDSHYFAGFVLNAVDKDIWRNIHRAILSGKSRGFRELFVWAYPQMMRDAFTYFELEEPDMRGFHDIRLPDNLAHGASGGPLFSTNITTLASGAEQRNQNWSEPLARYDVSYGVVTETDVSTLIGFYRARRGQANAFRFRDWADYSSAAVGTSPSPYDQTIGTGDGQTTEFALVKHYELDGPEPLVRRIRFPVGQSLRVAVNGDEVFNWTLAVTPERGTISFSTPPSIGDQITAGFEFDVPVRFAQDQLELTLETFRAGTVPSIPLIEVRLV
ncbi:MAG: DUF2460 domain-containing protein [Pseudomonadota bacterium]